jgi:hypothetical protein
MKHREPEFHPEVRQRKSCAVGGTDRKFVVRVGTGSDYGQVPRLAAAAAIEVDHGGSLGMTIPVDW